MSDQDRTTHPDTTKDPDQPTPGEALAKTQKGELPVGTVEQILKAGPKDIVKETVPIPEWGFSLVLKSFTAAASARIKSRGFAFREGETDVAWAEMEITQFLEGVSEPAFTEEQVRELHLSSGKGYQRVLNWLDENSGIDKEELKKSRDEFRKQSERPAV